MTFAELHPGETVQVRDEAHDDWRPPVQITGGPFVCEASCCWVYALPVGSTFVRRLHAARSREVRIVREEAR